MGEGRGKRKILGGRRELNFFEIILLQICNNRERFF
jgi:hypothetical protein